MPGNSNRDNGRKNATDDKPQKNELQENHWQAHAMRDSHGWYDERERADRNTQKIDESKKARALESAEQTEKQKRRRHHHTNQSEHCYRFPSKFERYREHLVGQNRRQRNDDESSDGSEHRMTEHREGNQIRFVLVVPRDCLRDISGGRGSEPERKERRILEDGQRETQQPIPWNAKPVHRDRHECDADDKRHGKACEIQI